ncbi:MAG: GNAT family N-acetyltransferase [Anaerolineae bacterium]|nr:GNAT family N-acetyltransferase [Anaerolineae bacterium]
MTVLFDFSQFPILATERLTLRQITHADADAISALFSAPEVLRFLNNPPMDTHEKAVGFIDWLARAFEQQEGVNWGITLTGQDQVIGMCGAYDWNRDNRHIDIGYHLLPAHWGQGYATEATRAIIRWCFQNLDLHRIQADCTAGNDASERVMIKCGFTLEGVWRESCWEHGRFVSIKQYGLLRREFIDLP